MSVIINGDSGITSSGDITINNGTADGGQVILSSSGYSNWNLDNYSGRFRAYYNATEYFTIDTSGNVGIGTNNPIKIVDIYKASLPQLRLSNSVSGTGVSDGYAMELSSADAYLWNYESGFLALGTSNTERMRIDSSGNVLVGKTSASSSTVGFEARPTGEVNTGSTASANTTTVWNTYSTGASAYRFYVGMGGTIYATSTTITAISDQRLKENIQDIDVGLDSILALKPRKFDWKEGKGKDKKGDRGWIAQEFEQVFPEMIDEWKDPAPEGEEPYKSVNADLIPVLVKAIQELSAKVEEQVKRIELLESK